MKIAKRLWISVAVTLAASFLIGAAPSDPMRNLAAQEQKFADLCKQVGIRDSFVAFFDDNVITFGPDLRVGADYLKSRPPNNASSPLLVWHAIYGDISSAGDLGFTTGPATLTLHPDDPAKKKDIDLSFFSIWRKQPGKDWKVIFDGGLTTLAPVPDEPLHQAPAAKNGFHPPVATAKQDLEATESKFADTARTTGILAALEAYSIPDVRVNRDDHLPVMGLAKAKELLKDSGGPHTLKPRETAVATSGDLGYSYGDIWTGAPDAGAKQLGYYAHVWRRHHDGWKIEQEIVIPLP